MALKHRDPGSPARTAVAPYNFVSAPAQPWAYPNKADGPRQVDHSAYHGNRLTGWIDVTLETRSPVYVRGPLTPVEFAQMEAEEEDDSIAHLKKLRNKPDFFYTSDPDSPVIPGSTIRGNLRTLAQIIGHGKLSPVSDEPLIYRAVADMSSHGQAYRNQLMFEEPGQKNHFTPRFKAGYIHRDGESWFIRPAQQVNGTTYARVHRRSIPRKLKKWRSCRNASLVYIETGPYEFQKVRGGFVHIKFSRVLRLLPEEAPGLQLGILAESGQIPNKNSEAVVFPPDENAQLIRIPDGSEGDEPDLVTAYRNQISPEQERLLGKGGVLRQDQPVFYLMRDDQLIFFGHTQMFRMPYESSPRGLLSAPHRDDRLTDYAEAIFGSAKGRDNSGQSGRVSVTDATLQPEQENPWLNEDAVVIPKILSGPKPTTFQHYLTQDRPDVEKGQGLYTYNNKLPQTSLRGFKLYWHKGDIRPGFFVEKKGEVDEEKDKQHTKMKPVRSGVSFRFRVHFENLLLDELGLLWWTVALPAEGEFCHKLGMGKPLGLGAVKLTPSLQIVNPTVRYKNLFSSTKSAWQEAVLEPEISMQFQSRAVTAFEESILKFLDSNVPSFGKLPQIQELLTMLSWPGPQPADELTRYMEIEREDEKAKRGKRNEYRERPVLPTPQGVMKQSRKVPPSLHPISSPVKGPDPKVPDGYQTGRVKNFGEKGKSFGFIQPDSGGPDVFVHQSQLSSGIKTLRPGQRVMYRIEKSPKGLQAEDVQLI